MPALQNLILQAVRAYKELARKSLAAPGDSLSVNITPRKYLLVETHVRRIGTIDVRLRFNDDLTGTHNWRNIADSGGVTFANSQNHIQLLGGAALAVHIQFTSFIHNHREMEKLLRAVGASSGALGAGNQSIIVEASGKWANTTDVITRVTLVNDNTGDFNTGTEIIVSGHD